MNTQTTWKDRYWQARERRKTVRGQNMNLINLSYYTLEWHFLSLAGWGVGLGVMALIAFLYLLLQRFVPNVEPHLFVPWAVVILRFFTQLDQISLSHVNYLSSRMWLFNMYFSFCAAYNLYLGMVNEAYLSALIDRPWIYFIPYAKEVFNI